MGDKDFVKIINKHRMYMVQNIDLRNTLLWEALVQGEVIGQTQLNSIKETNHNNIQQVSALIMHLHRRSYRDWCKFIECLRENDNGHVADKLEGKTD